MNNDERTFEKLSRSSIEKAGKNIAKCSCVDECDLKDLEIVDKWRSQHAKPLEIITSIIKNIFSDNREVYVVQRLKRLESIISKLQRSNNTGLYRMQDLGGCRVILPEIDNFYEVVNTIKEGVLQNRHEVLYENDYLNSPRSVSGYRSYHIVVKFHDDSLVFDGMLIEVQVRTKLENIWATAVEIVDRMTNDTLKAGTGNADNAYFFKLVSGLFSIKEKTSIVEGIPKNIDDIIHEIYDLDSKINIRDKLAGYNAAIKNLTGDLEKGDYYLLVIQNMRNTLRISKFSKDNLEKANSMYSNLEMSKGEEKIDVVLVAAESLSIIRECYPNYFSDTLQFLNKINEFCLPHKESSNLSINLNDRSYSFSKCFDYINVKPNYFELRTMGEDGIGDFNGDTIICHPWSISLENSYLRYSGIVFDNNTIKELSLEKYKNLNDFEGAAVIALETGACFFVNKDKWSVISPTGLKIIKPKNNNNDYLYFLIAWMKSNVCTWHILWQKHAYSFTNRIIKNFSIPDLNEKDFFDVCNYSKKIIDKEMKFVKNYPENSDDRNLIEGFNSEIASILVEIDKVFLKHYNIAFDDYLIMLKEITKKGFYPYYKEKEECESMNLRKDVLE